MNTQINLEIFKADTTTLLPLPYADGGIRAGFPSPAQDYMDQVIDLNKELVRNPSTTFYGRVCGDSMKDAGLDEGDILVIDKSRELEDGEMAVCYIDGEFTVKYVEIDTKRKIVWLVPANPDYPNIEVTPDNDFLIWGIVTYVIKDKRKKHVRAR